jgi:hypothetical protein
MVGVMAVAVGQPAWTWGQTNFGFQSAPSMGLSGDWNNPFAGAAIQLPAWSGGSTLAPNMAPIRPTWQLGAYTNNTDTGVGLSGIQGGSIAQQSGE